MSFLEKLNDARMQSFERDLASDWEKRLEAAHIAVKDYLLYKAAITIRRGDFEGYDEPYEYDSDETPDEARGLGNKITALLAKRLRDDGLEVELFQNGVRLSFRAFLPQLPDYLRARN